MHTFFRATLCVLTLLAAATSPFAPAQQVIPLAPADQAPAYPELHYFSKAWNTEVVSNVTQPSLTVYAPPASQRNGTAVVICPGGGYMALSITSEGVDVARYLNARGVTAFVLKYHLMHTGTDATTEFVELYKDHPRFMQRVAEVEPLAVADALGAVTYVKQHAAEWGIQPERVGIMGFSAGGAITTEVGYHYTAASRPAFVAPIYPGHPLHEAAVPADAPPLFVAAASDDSLGLAPQSVALYSQWLAAHKTAELHLYAKGGHGFGMKHQGLPTDHWIDRFADWLGQQGFLPAR
ncbi:MAG: alpha/beta hydrolase [Acidobacteriota bacterium]|nr:alpha/beta hydrolase [Acidobacteriota bacterium]